jgi:hypothetical protein
MCVGCPDPDKMRKAIAKDADAPNLEPKPELNPKAKAELELFFKQQAQLK